MAADEAFHHALRDVAAALAEIPSPSMIVGGVAVIAAGVGRAMIDIDVTIAGRSTELQTIADAFGRHGIVPRITDAIGFGRERQVLLLRHEASGVTVEVLIAWLPFEEEALRHSLQVEFEGVTIRVARPEDLIVYKAHSLA